MKGHNIERIAGRPSPFEGDSFAAFDALPAPIRRQLHEGTDWCPLWVRAQFRRALGHMSPDSAVQTIVEGLRRADAVERANFAAAYEIAHGHDYPARAAGSTVLRYDEAARHARRRPRRTFR